MDKVNTGNMLIKRKVSILMGIIEEDRGILVMGMVMKMVMEMCMWGMMGNIRKWFRISEINGLIRTLIQMIIIEMLMEMPMSMIIIIHMGNIPLIKTKLT